VRAPFIPAVALFLAALLPAGGRAAEPYEIYAIEALTGPSSFAGQAQAASLRALEPVVNRAGGINGRPVKFVIEDEGSSIQTALQLINQIETNAKVPFLLGPSDAGACNAAFPLVAKAGPVIYCTSGAAQPPVGGYGFSADVASSDLVVAGMRYLRLKGFTRIALLTTTDATGQLYDKAVDVALALPENAKSGMQLVAHEHYANSEINVTAQIARIKSANAQVLLLGATGTATGVAFHAMSDLGLEIPVFTGNGNASFVQMDQYAKILPPKLYFFSFLCLVPDEVYVKQNRAVLATYAQAMRAAGIRADGLQSSTWDPALIMISALRKLGTDATPEQLRDYVANLQSFYGANGHYDFTKTPIRGLDDSQVLIGLWDPNKPGWRAVSHPGGVPLPGR
jgi:branched-chain amino acid transport system substrate-binding protein